MPDIGDAVKRAVGPRATGAAAPAPHAAAAVPAPPTDVSASRGARLVALLLLVVGFALAVWVPGKDAMFTPESGFVLLAGFYIAAQAVERLLELALPPGGGTAQAKADRALIMGGLACMVGIAASLVLGLRFLSAVQVDTSPQWLDVFVTGLVISGGTKPLHDLIGLIEKAKPGS